MKINFKKKLGFFFIVLYMPITNIWANDIVGKWKAINDKTGVYEANVEIYLNKKNKYEGTIERVFDLQNGTQRKMDKCIHCSGDLKNQPIIGFRVLSDFIKSSKDSNEYINGLITDPETGKAYKGTIRMSPNGRKITLKGYVGITILGRTQTWIRNMDE